MMRLLASDERLTNGSSPTKVTTTNAMRMYRECNAMRQIHDATQRPDTYPTSPHRPKASAATVLQVEHGHCRSRLLIVRA